MTTILPADLDLRAQVLLALDTATALGFLPWHRETVSACLSAARGLLDGTVDRADAFVAYCRAMDITGDIDDAACAAATYAADAAIGLVDGHRETGERVRRSLNWSHRSLEAAT